ncbi:MAG TPA: hypothetical protein VJ396_04405 [Acidiferrobacterales bacterium]|nr:hypothetical protein [Acidiferrobacterales bacterium]
MSIPRRFRSRILLSTLLLAAVSAEGQSEGWEYGGHLKYQYTFTGYRNNDVAALFGEDPASDHSFDGRLKAEWRGRGLDFAAHYEVLALTGDSVKTRRLLAAAGLLTGGTLSGLPDDRHRLFDLTDDFVDESRAAAVQRLDRLSLGYTSGSATLRFGRQAVSWGNGLVFQVLDFVNPFSPLAIDKEYKTGEDMLYGQWQWAGLGDAQLMLLPRRDPLTRELDHEQASQALKLHAHADHFDVDLLAARHYDQTLLGFGVVRSIGGAVWRFDASHTDVPGRDGVWSLVTNLDYSWVLFGKNMYGFAEYYRNGFGGARASGYSAADPELTARLARGEIYTVGRDYAALGAQVELSPLVNAFASVIQNLNDASRTLQVRGVYDWRQDTQFMAGISLPDGEAGSEYGGLPTGLPGVRVAPGRFLYLRAAHYF